MGNGSNSEWRLRNILALYLGTNSFHNFSSIDERRIEKKKSKEKSRKLLNRRETVIHRDHIQDENVEKEEPRRDNNADRPDILEGAQPIDISI